MGTDFLFTGKNNLTQSDPLYILTMNTPEHVSIHYGIPVSLHLPISQTRPVNPLEQSHSYPSITEKQEPPFSQGEAKQLSFSAIVDSSSNEWVRDDPQPTYL